MSRYLVTGGAGFIGSNIVERLLNEGHFVRVIDNFFSGKKENLNFVLGSKKKSKEFELLKTDIRNYGKCLKACKGIDYVLHQAALRSVPKSMEEPHEFNAVNIDGTLNMLEASLESKIKRFVFASSSSVYGEAVNFPQKETDTPLLISPYALSKLAGEYYCRIFSHNYGLETVSLRYFNVFGNRQSADDEYAVVIPKFIQLMLSDKNPPIHGTGKQSRDFTHVDNVVEANLLAASLPGIKCDVLNVALGDDHSILGLVDDLNDLMKKSIKPSFTEPRAGDVMRTCADVSKMKSMLSYTPKVKFREGLTSTIEWLKAHL